MMTNVTATGAILRCKAPSWLPYRFQVGIASETNLMFCELRRISETGVGILFIDAREQAVASQARPAVLASDYWTGARPVRLTD